LTRKYNKYLEIKEILSEYKSFKYALKKKSAHEMYYKGIKIIDIISLLKVPSTTVRRWLKEIIITK
jgi:transposase-like protein